jgi:hypothetical protein
MQRIQGEQPPGLAELVDELLGRRNFMGLARGADQYMTQDQGAVGGQST